MIYDEDTAQQIRMCAACPKMCRHVCPTFLAWRSESPTPHGRALLLHQEITGTRPLDDRAIEVLYQCLECSHCLTWCLPEIDIADIVETRRRQLVEEGRFPSGLNPMVDSIRTHHNPYKEPHEKRIDWLKISTIDGRSLVYFTGCTAAYREKSIAQDTVSVLSSLGYQVHVPEDEWCCGSPLLRTGFVEDALEQARHNVEILNSIDAEEVVVTCPGCYRVLTQDYPKHGLEINKPVRHIAELLQSHLKNLPEFELDGPVTFHDSCHLGRHSGVYEQPREVIERVSKGVLVEMERNRDNAMCCGNGAGLRTLFPEHAKKIGAERVRQAERTGAKYLVTSCPFCKNMLESQAKDSLIVLDLPELVEMAKKQSHVKTD